MLNSPEARIAVLDGQIEMAKLFAQHHLVQAQTGYYKQRKVFHGCNGPEFTDEEKLQDTLNTATTHIMRIQELTRSKVDIYEDACNARGALLGIKPDASGNSNNS